MNLGLLVALENEDKHTNTQTRFMFYKYRKKCFHSDRLVKKNKFYPSISEELFDQATAYGKKCNNFARESDKNNKKNACQSLSCSVKIVLGRRKKAHCLM